MPQLRDEAEIPPGGCIVCGQHRAPLIDMQRGCIHQPLLWCYLCESCVTEAAQLLGMATAQALAGAEEQIAGLEAALEQAGAQAAEDDLLRDAVAYTLEKGAVAAEDGTIKLRVRPGRQKLALPSIAEREAGKVGVAE